MIDALAHQLRGIWYRLENSYDDRYQPRAWAMSLCEIQSGHDGRRFMTQNDAGKR